MTSVTIRPATLDDATDLAAIRAAAVGHLVQTAAGMRARLSEADLAGAWCAAREGVVVGFATCRRPHRGAARLTVFVQPRHQRAGIGRSLERVASAYARDAGADRVASVADGPAGRAFAVAAAYAVGREHRFSGVALADVPPAPTPPSDVSVVPLGEVDPHVVWQLHDSVVSDDPSGLSISQPYETWKAEDWDFPDHASDLGVGVIANNTLVAFTHVFADRERGRIWSAMTGVRGDHRGRGLARLAKAVSLAWSREAGMTHAFTANDAANHAMLAVNTALGYRPAAQAWSVARSTQPD